MRALIAIVAAALSLFAIPLTAGSQAAEIHRISALLPPVIYKTFRIEMFQQGLKDLGYVEGNNYVLESRFTATWPWPLSAVTWRRGSGSPGDCNRINHFYQICHTY